MMLIDELRFLVFNHLSLTENLTQRNFIKEKVSNSRNHKRAENVLNQR
jgi:ABC-type polar amino acid transport system ATPase subunit